MDLKDLQSEFNALSKEFNQALVAQERRFAVQDNVLIMLTDIREAIKVSEKEIKEAMQDLRGEIYTKESDFNKRLNLLEKDHIERKNSRDIIWTVLKIQWYIVGGCCSGLIAIIGLHLNKLF